jgi:2-iminoacetate synthase
VVSTREPAELRDELLFMGASQISAGSRTSPWGYIMDGDTEQFETVDKRSLEDVIDRIADIGLIPSLCTSCYRRGRSGGRFKDLTEGGITKRFCQDNALLSLKEYIEDFASGDIKKHLIRRLIEELEKSSNGILEKIALIDAGQRDIHV